jgi:hypothetical protein
MKNLTKFLLFGAIATISTLSLSANTMRNEEKEYKVFNDCWGSGDFTKSCTNGTAIVRGCQPDPGSTCVGERKVPTPID